ncbi:MAG: hypothetical protein HKP40_11885 [Litoreibacter sp.]|nr:hypothetical protein [Litoreibacter sp.]
MTSLNFVPDTFTATSQGARFSPYTLAEYKARAARREPGLTPVLSYVEAQVAEEETEWDKTVLAGYAAPAIAAQPGATRTDLKRYETAAKTGGNRLNAAQVASQTPSSGASNKSNNTTFKIANERLRLRKVLVSGQDYAVVSPACWQWSDCPIETDAGSTLRSAVAVRTGCGVGEGYFSNRQKGPTTVVMPLICG